MLIGYIKLFSHPFLIFSAFEVYYSLDLSNNKAMYEVTTIQNKNVKNTVEKITINHAK